MTDDVRAEPIQALEAAVAIGRSEAAQMLKVARQRASQKRAELFKLNHDIKRLQLLVMQTNRIGRPLDELSLRQKTFTELARLTPGASVVLAHRANYHCSKMNCVLRSVVYQYGDMCGMRFTTQHVGAKREGLRVFKPVCHV